MIEGWAPKDESYHLRFGIEYHSAIQDYDMARAEGVSHEKSIHRAVRNLLTRIHTWDVDIHTKAGNYKNRGTLLQLVVDYFDFFAQDPAETFILENGKAAVELSFKFEMDWGPYNPRIELDIPHGHPSSTPQPYILCGHLDRVVNYQGNLFVVDHKTTTTTPSSYFFNQFEPNNQMTLYTLASQIVLDAPVKGVIVEASQILLTGPSRFVRSITYRTKDQLDEWVGDLHHLLAIAEHYATTNYWPMNDTACDKFGGCKFREVCSKSPSVRQNFLKADFVKLPEEEKWNPLKPR
jgi:hypothetical protein